MYLSSDDARSDFFLTAAVYIIGPTVLRLLVESTGSLFANEAGIWLLTVAQPILLVAAMPLYLMRYRGEAWGTLVSGPAESIGLGLAVGAPVIIGTLLGDLRGGTNVVDALLGSFTNTRILTGRVLLWLSLAVLVIFLHRRAEYAFRSISERREVLVQRAAVATVAAAVIATVLLLPTGLDIGQLLAPLGFGGAFLVAMRLLKPTGMGEQWQVYAPLITLALGSLEIFSLLFAPTDFLAGVRTAGMVCGFGLIGIMGLEARKGGRLVIVLALTIALLTSVTVFLR